MSSRLVSHFVLVIVRIDTIGRTALSHDFDCLSGQPHGLADALDGLTNNENSLSSFYMRALFWIFPSILNIGKKGQMIKQTRKELGDIATRLWRDAKAVGNSDDKNLISLMRKETRCCIGQRTNTFVIVKQDANTSNRRMNEDEIAAQ